jgi:LacI family transcriptional regulator
MSKVTLQDIASFFNVSINTVSKALRGIPGVNEQLRNDICKKAMELGYKKVNLNIEDEEQELTNISVLCRKENLSTETFWPKIISSIGDYASSNDINISMNSIDPLREVSTDVASYIGKYKPHGLIIVGTMAHSFLSQIESLQIPFVVIDHYDEDINCDYILTDNIFGIYAAVKHLKERNHKNIGFINNKDTSVSFYERQNAYIKYMTSFNLQINEDYLWTQGEYIIRDYYKKMINFYIGRQDFPSAFICVNDTTAITFIGALEELGLRVPEDISIIGFDNVSEVFYHGLTTIDVPKENLGDEAIKQLMIRITNPDSVYKKILLQPSLVERDSVKHL